MTGVAKFFTAFGDENFTIPIVVLSVVLCFFKRTRKYGFSILFAVIIGTLITNVIAKPMVLRIRPYNTLQQNADYWSWYIGSRGAERERLQLSLRPYHLCRRGSYRTVPVL